MKHPLHDVRESYLHYYRQAVQRLRTEYERGGPEILFKYPVRGGLEKDQRIARADFIGVRDGQSDNVIVTAPFRTVTNWLWISPPIVCIDAPLVWYGIEFHVQGRAPEAAALDAWVSEWLDPAEKRYDRAAEFQQVIHSLLPPQATDAGYMVSVDFGSAPTLAFDQFLKLLVPGAIKISIGSFALLEQEKMRAR
jgi:hypothetical protein